MNSAVSMADVAARAGVSLSTVSRALGGAPGVSEVTRERIRRVAADLAYVVSPEASSLSRGSTGRVGVVVPGVTPWYYSSAVAGIGEVLRAAGLDLLLYEVPTPQDRDHFFDQLPARRKVDALVVVSLPVTSGQLTGLDALGASVVVAGATSPDHPWVAVDDVAAAAAAADHLVALGHERIAMIRTHEPDAGEWHAVEHRLEGFRAALDGAGLHVPPELLVTVPWGPDGGARAMDQLLRLADPPTGVFAYSDDVAIGALRSLRRARVDVPAAMSVVGLDDHPMADLLDLTTVAQDPRDLGRRAAVLVLQSLGRDVPATFTGRDEVRSGQRPPTHLVVRGTSAPPRPAGSRLAVSARSA